MWLQVTETRTGPLGCSNYDNLDTVSSVLVHSPENKVQLQGEAKAFHVVFYQTLNAPEKGFIKKDCRNSLIAVLMVKTNLGDRLKWFLKQSFSAYLPSTGLQAILPGYLQSLFIQAALNYIGCKSEGQFVCQHSDCWCECSAGFPQCNCPHSDLDTLEKNLLRIKEAWRRSNQEFEESGESEILIHCDLQSGTWKCQQERCFKRGHRWDRQGNASRDAKPPSIRWKIHLVFVLNGFLLVPVLQTESGELSVTVPTVWGSRVHLLSPKELWRVPQENVS